MSFLLNQVPVFGSQELLDSGVYPNYTVGLTLFSGENANLFFAGVNKENNITDDYDKSSIVTAGNNPLESQEMHYFTLYSTSGYNNSHSTKAILKSDLICNTLTIDSDYTLYTNGYKIICTNLIVNGTISANGKSGRHGVVRSTNTPTSYANENKYPPFRIARVSGTASSYERDYRSLEYETESEAFESTIGRDSGYGGLGRLDTNISEADTVDNAGGKIFQSAAFNTRAELGDTVTYGGYGGAGGNASSNLGVGTGYAGGTTQSNFAINNFQNLYNGYGLVHRRSLITSFGIYTNTIAPTVFGGGAGGGGGGSIRASGATGFVTSGGCGGDGGKCIHISARDITVGSTGKITANGGNGGNGRIIWFPDVTLGSASGPGGGGGGGWIFLFYEKMKITPGGEISAKGGLSGSAFSGGGFNPTPGDPGRAGTIYLFSTKRPNELNTGGGWVYDAQTGLVKYQP